MTNKDFDTSVSSTTLFLPEMEKNDRNVWT